MNEIFPAPRGKRRLLGMRLVLLHVFVTVLAIVIAFSLPLFAEYVLFRWWPRVAQDSTLLIATEVGLAATLVLLFNAVHVAWENRSKVRAAEMAALVYARHGASWLARWRERRLVNQLPATRDAFMLTLTGFDTFASKSSLLREKLASAYEIRVLLLNPAAVGAERRINSLPDDVTMPVFSREVAASLTYLQYLRTLGKKVSVKFYEKEPFWKVAVLGDHVWVQYCHHGVEVKHEPEYVFALNRDNPRQGLFVPFYMYFLDRWEDTRHPDYDFDSRELVYRDKMGNEIRREPLGGYVAYEQPVPALA